MPTPPPVTATRHATPTGNFVLSSRKPARALAPFVRDLCGFVEHDARPVRRLELPAAMVVLAFDFSRSTRITDAAGRTFAHRDGFVAGLDDGPCVTEHPGDSEVLQVNLTPIGARLVLGLPMDSIARRLVGLEDALPRDARGLPDRLANARGWAERFDALEAFLLARLERSRPVPGWIVAAWDRIERSAGASRVRDTFMSTGKEPTSVVQGVALPAPGGRSQGAATKAMAPAAGRERENGVSARSGNAGFGPPPPATRRAGPAPAAAVTMYRGQSLRCSSSQYLSLHWIESRRPQALDTAPTSLRSRLGLGPSRAQRDPLGY